MAKVLIGLGSVIILHTLVAKLTGIAAITDYFPVEWFSDVSKGGSYYKIELVERALLCMALYSCSRCCNFSFRFIVNVFK